LQCWGAEYGCSSEFDIDAGSGMREVSFMSSALHFLVVDDTPTVRWIIISMLRKIGYMKVSAAENGGQALAHLQADSVSGMPVDFVVTDWNMPVMSGMDLLQSIRATASLTHLPVLMITTESGVDSIAAAVRAGADGYIVKPFLTAAILKREIDNILIGRGLAA
jgi:two-component system, chemotaxis family, chemotaxis protein CheY